MHHVVLCRTYLNSECGCCWVNVMSLIAIVLLILSSETIYSCKWPNALAKCVVETSLWQLFKWPLYTPFFFRSAFLWPHPHWKQGNGAKSHSDACCIMHCLVCAVCIALLLLMVFCVLVCFASRLASSVDEAYSMLFWRAEFAEKELSEVQSAGLGGGGSGVWHRTRTSITGQGTLVDHQPMSKRQY